MQPLYCLSLKKNRRPFASLAKACLNVILFFLFICFLNAPSKLKAQAFLCPQVTASPDVTICSGCTNLNASVRGTVTTTSYTVSSAPYNPFPYNSGTSVLLGIDDTWSSVITLPFCFQFYGNTYTQLIIGSNGIISFDLTDAGGYCNWSLSASNTLPNTTLPPNSIMGVYEDIDPTNMGGIYYQTVGTAPCRAFVVSFDQVPHYGDPNSVSPGSCSGAMFATYQMVLYESTNIIEINIQDKQACNGWNGGRGIEGIMNASGTSAVTVSGRNCSVWTATNDCYRFTPSGSPQYTVTWLDGSNNTVGTDTAVSVCPTTTTTYTAKVVNTTCNGPITVTDQVTVTVTPPPCSGVTCNFTAQGDTVCEGGTIALTASNVSGATYLWTGPNGYTSAQQNPSISNAAVTHTGWYHVKDSIPSCSTMDSVYVLVNTPPIANAGVDQTTCGGTITLAGTISGGTSTGTWTGGSGSFTPNASTLNCTYTPSPSEISAGSVTLTLNSDDPIGPCGPSSDQMTISFSAAATVNAGTSQTVCAGSTLTLSGTVSGAAGGTWSGGNGSYVPSDTALNAAYTPTASEYSNGSAQLILTSVSGGGCPDASDSVTMYFSQIPIVDFIADTTLGCPGLCINLSDLTTVGGTGIVDSWNWDFGDGSPTGSTSNPSHCYATSGSYTISLTTITNDGCTSTAVKNNYIQVAPTPVAEFEATPNPATTLAPDITMNNLSSQDVTHWSWAFGDSTFLDSIEPSPTHTYPDDTARSYTVTLLVYNAGGCYDTVEHIVSIGPGFTFFVPNAFTPNKDGRNEFFYAAGTGISKFEMRIFDRWGNMLFHSHDINEKWDGKADGPQASQIDVYVWKISLTDIFNKAHNYVGTVTVMR